MFGVLVRFMYSGLVGGLPFVARVALLACVYRVGIERGHCTDQGPAIGLESILHHKKLAFSP